MLSPIAEAQRPLIDVFRVGVYGGHRPSINVIEQRLAALPQDEHEIVGRSVYETAADAHSQLLATNLQLLSEAQNAHADLQEEHLVASNRWRSALDEADERAAAARDHIGHLEGVQAELQSHNAKLDAKLSEIWDSTSWRMTRPLRGAFCCTRLA